MLLTKQDLQDLTGTPLKAKQIEWLRARNWVFETNVRGQPRVLRAYAEKRMGVQSTNHSGGAMTVPNFA